MALTNEEKAAFEAVRNADLAQLLVFGAVDANVRDDEGRSLLGAAIVKRNPTITLLLLQRGADPNGTTEKDSRPHLHFAVEAGSTGTGGIDVVEILIQKGADVAGVDGKGNTVLHVAANAGPMQLYSAYMTRYLLGAGAEVQAANNRGQTPLHLAVTTIARETVKLLCQHGAAIDVADEEGRTPLDLVRETWEGDSEYEHLVAEYTAILEQFGASS